MHVLTAYLNSLDTREQQDFARRCNTSVGYLRKAVCNGQRLGEILCLHIDTHSRGEVKCESLRPDIDWSLLLNWAKRRLEKQV
ncbi:MAG: helix-turn-helix domain-containing protein [Burkholderiaceae bacterium]|nr:helix-turn-helix domain-containing protein [Burkholderiaceae bacterium]